MPGAANIHKLNACGLLIIKRLLIIDEEGMIKDMLIRVLITIEDHHEDKNDQKSQCLSRPAAFYKEDPFCYQGTCYQRMNIKVQEKRRTCVSECICALTIYVYCWRHVLDRD